MVQPLKTVGTALTNQSTAYGSIRTEISDSSTDIAKGKKK